MDQDNMSEPRASSDCESGSPFPRRPVEVVTRPFLQFLHVESASGVLLVVCTIVALLLANSPWAERYNAFWSTTLRIGAGSFELAYPLWYWVNDALMAIFFFVVGLEIKREVSWGELSEGRKVVLPVVAALGGVVGPILLFLALTRGHPEGRDGWAVPMATDIAFVVGCMAILGKRVPHGLKVLVLSLAIVDDILAVLVIACFYTASIQTTWLAAAGAGLVLAAILNRVGVRAVPIYVFVGAGIWLATLKAGIHPTVAGVLLGLMTPARAWIGHATLLEVVGVTKSSIEARVANGESRIVDGTSDLALAAKESIAPLDRLELALHPWVGFVIMPIFALANAGVTLEAKALTSRLAMAIGVGLLAGKPIGILTASWLAVKLNLASLPDGVSWRALLGAGVLCGIGFTMALFIASLGLEGASLVAAKGGILMGSLASAILGMALLVNGLGRGRA